MHPEAEGGPGWKEDAGGEAMTGLEGGEAMMGLDGGEGITFGHSHSVCEEHM